MTRIETYAALVEAEGLIVERIADDDDRLAFRYEGDRYEILTYASDEDYVGISVTYALPTGVTRAAALRETNDATRRNKIVKAYVLPTRAVTIAAELLHDDPEEMELHLLRLIRAMQMVGNEVFARLRAEAAGRAV